MSVYYNVRIDGNENGTINSYRVGRNDNILDNQSNYEVGVVRFCIPNGSIPKYSVDMENNNHQLGFDFAYKSPPTTYTNQNLGTSATEGKRHYGGLVNLDGENTTLDQLIHSYQNTNNTYNGNSHNTTIGRNGLYEINNVENKVIKSFDEMSVISILNAGLRSAFYEQTQNFQDVYYQEGASATNSSYDGGTIENHSFGNNTGGTINEFTLAKVDIGDGTNINTISHTCENLVATKSSGYYLLLSNVECDNGGSLCNLEIEVDYVINGKTQTNIITQGLNNHTKLTNNLIFSNNVPQNAEELINSGNISYGTDFRTAIDGNVKVKKNYCLRPTINPCFLDEGAVISGATINLRLTNRGQGNIKVGYIQYCYNAYHGATTKTSTRNRQLYPFYDSKVPYFSYDSNDNKITLHTEKNQFIDPNKLTNGNRIILSPTLKSILNFDTRKCPSNFTIKNSWESSVYTTKNINNKAFYLHTETNKENNIDLADKTEKSVNIKELSSSNENRSNLRSLIIASTSLSVNGEILSNNKESRKILTDFEPNFEDKNNSIYQYYAGGYVRYYPLNSTTPLREVGLKILYEDINGNINAWNLEEGEVITIKLEFRPKNMIQYYQN